jgi:hypothetical protein
MSVSVSGCDMMASLYRRCETDKIVSSFMYIFSSYRYVLPLLSSFMSEMMAVSSYAWLSFYSS